MARINKELVIQLSSMINTQLPLTNLEVAIPKYKAKGLSKTRFVWDCLWCVPHDKRDPWIKLVYSEGCNDNHIETALNSWFTSTGLEY